MQMGFVKEFKEFAVKGNMIDIAIGVVIGSAFNKVIDVIVKEIVMPPLSILTGAVDFSDYKLILKPAEYLNGSIVAPEVAMSYGRLLDVLIDFMIIALTVFLVVKFMNRLRNKSQDTNDKTISTPKNIELLNDMKTLLQEQNELLRRKNQ